jgi:hypothetical protein
MKLGGSVAKREKVKVSKVECVKDIVMQKRIVIVSVEKGFLKQVLRVDKKLKLVRVDCDWTDKVHFEFEEVVTENKLDPDDVDEEAV